MTLPLSLLLIYFLNGALVLLHDVLYNLIAILKIFLLAGFTGGYIH